MNKSIITITMNPAIDKSASVPQVIADRKLYCTSPRFEPGGGGINVSRVVRILGGESTTMFPSGGPSGAHLEKLLEGESLTCHSIPVQGWTRENLVVLEESSGRQFRFGMPGALLDEQEWRRCLDMLAAVDDKPAYIVASGSLPSGVPDDFYARVARIGKEMGAKVIIDTSGNPLQLALQEGVFLIKPNLRELGEMVGKDVADDNIHQEMAMQMVKDGKSAVVVLSMGAGGILVASATGCERVRAPVVPIKSKVGAGDSLVAGMVLSLARGEELRDAVRFGVAAGAAAVMTPGSELCRREDVERLHLQISKDSKTDRP